MELLRAKEYLIVCTRRLETPMELISLLIPVSGWPFNFNNSSFLLDVERSSCRDQYETVR